MTVSQQVQQLTELAVIFFWCTTLTQLVFFVMIILSIRRRR